MNEDSHEDQIEDAMGSIFLLIKKSGNAADSNDAMKFSQAALNAANTLSIFSSMDETETKDRLDELEDVVNQISSHLVMDRHRQ